MIMKKTKIMSNNYIADHGIKIHDKVIECVQDYIYLRQKIGDVQIMKKKKYKDGMEYVLLVDNTML